MTLRVTRVREDKKLDLSPRKLLSEQMESDAELVLGKMKLLKEHFRFNDESSAEDIKEELYRQTFGPVKWVDTINKLAENGVTKIYEIGPGKVLAGLIKKINKNIEVINIENVEAINTLVI